MAVLRLRGQALSVLVSALYLAHSRSGADIELAREDLLGTQILPQGTDRLTSLMWKVIDPLLTKEWEVFRVAFDGVTRKSAGRVGLLDSAQASIELEERAFVSVVEAASWRDPQSVLWLPELEDPRLEAKIVSTSGLRDLQEPVIVDIHADDPPGTYSQYGPLGGGQTLFTRHETAAAIDEGNAVDFAERILNRLGELETFLLDEL